MTELQVSKEFLAEEQQLGQTMPKSREGQTRSYLKTLSFGDIL